MSEKISRRSLFTLTKRDDASPNTEPEKSSRFSLTDFYAKRTPGGAAIPSFAVRAPTLPVPTTNVGVTRASHAPWELARGPREDGAPKLGGPVAVVRSACLAWQGSPCWTCSERCPVEGAIALEAGRPIIDPRVCDGCGECVAACPAPHNALKLAEHVTDAGAKA